MCADYAFKGGIDFLDGNFGVFLIAALAGMVLCAAGLIGWGVSSSKSVCAGLGTVALLASFAVCILGSLVGSTNVHGPFFLIFLPMLLISLSGLMLLLIAAVRKGSSKAL
jgi:hypothetical protein